MLCHALHPLPTGDGKHSFLSSRMALGLLLMTGGTGCHVNVYLKVDEQVRLKS